MHRQSLGQANMQEHSHAPQRRRELDILRGIAVLLILGRHLLFIPDALPVFVKGFFLAWREIGWIGVDLFFVLSGFLVSGLLFSEHQRVGKIRIARFLVRRGFKIYPAFYFFLSVSLLTSLFIDLPSGSTIQEFTGEALFIQNYYGAVWNHTWSLAVEEHFYLILAGLISVLIRIRPTAQNPFRFLPTIIGVTACFLFTLRVMISFRYAIGDWNVVFPYTHLRIDSLFFGVWLAYLYHYQQDVLSILLRSKPILITLACSTTILPLLFPLDKSRFMYSSGFTLLYLGCGAILLLFLNSQFKRKEILLDYLEPLAKIGKNSYSIYLWHMMVYHLSVKLCFPESNLMAFSLQAISYLLGAIVVGSLSAYLVEFPVLRMRERWIP